MTIDMWLWLFVSIVSGILLGIKIYSIENKISYKQAISIKWELTKLSFKQIFNKKGF